MNVSGLPFTGSEKYLPGILGAMDHGNKRICIFFFGLVANNSIIETL